MQPQSGDGPASKSDKGLRARWVNGVDNGFFVLLRSRPMGGIELVIFDCDGVLIDSEAISANMLIAELRGYGVEMDLAFVSRHFLGRSYPTVLREVRESFGVVLPERFEADYRKRLLAAFERDLRINPGVLETIGRLSCPFCLATSSSPERVRMSLELVGLSAIFGERVYTASRVAHGKPAPDLFLFAANAMGAEPQNCLVIEDSLNGVQAGLAAGMEVWRYMGGSHLRGVAATEAEAVRPHRHFDDFSQFFDGFPELARQEETAP